MILFLNSVSPTPEFCVIEKNNIISSIKIIDKKSNKISDNIINKYFAIDSKFKLKTAIDKLVVCTGPGSYTALRVGITFMYGLSYAKNIPLIGLSCLDLIKLYIIKSKINKIALIVCSSNNQIYISYFSHKNKKFNTEKIDNNIINRIDFNSYDQIISNYNISLKKLNISYNKKIKLVNFSEIICLNYKKIKSIKSTGYIEPVYVSDNIILR